MLLTLTHLSLESFTSLRCSRVISVLSMIRHTTISRKHSSTTSIILRRNSPWPGVCDLQPLIVVELLLILTTDKLLHRDMGPVSRYLGSEVPKDKHLIWQDPLPTASYKIIDDADVKQLKQDVLSAPNVDISNLVTTAWGSASTFRISDKRGGANGARIALQPQRSFAVNNPERLAVVLESVSNGCTSISNWRACS